MTNMEIIEKLKEANNIPMDMQLYTFNEWRRMGFMVKRGEHAKLTADLWKAKKYMVENDDDKKDDGDLKVITKYIKTKAYLFTRLQVEPIGLQA